MKYNYLVDLVEDLRHATMKLRHYMSREDLDQVKGTPGTLVKAAKKEAATSDARDEDMKELELANYLVGQYEQAVVVLGSMIQE